MTSVVPDIRPVMVAKVATPESTASAANAKANFRWTLASLSRTRIRSIQGAATPSLISLL